MKKSIVLLVLSIMSLARTVIAAGPDEVAGIRWESPQAQVRQTIIARQGITLEVETPTDQTFKGGTFAGFNVKSWRFTFENDKLSSVKIAFIDTGARNEKGWKLDQEFEAIQKLLERKYGKTRSSQSQVHQARNWEFSDKLDRRVTKTIELYRCWGNERNGLELTYTYIRQAPPKKPLAPAQTKDL
jgi:hypothetical protein